MMTSPLRRRETSGKDAILPTNQKARMKKWTNQKTWIKHVILQKRETVVVMNVEVEEIVRRLSHGNVPKTAGVDARLLLPVNAGRAPLHHQHLKSEDEDREIR